VVVRKMKNSSNPIGLKSHYRNYWHKIIMSHINWVIDSGSNGEALTQSAFLQQCLIWSR
jgi:hypothetical protein